MGRETCLPTIWDVGFAIGDDGIQLEGESNPDEDVAVPDSLRILSTNLQHYAINAGVNHVQGGTISDGALPAPNSKHEGGVHMLWCDGRVSFVSENIDAFVYARSLTWAGNKKGEAISGSGPQGGGGGGQGPRNPRGGQF